MNYQITRATPETNRFSRYVPFAHWQVQTFFIDHVQLLAIMSEKCESKDEAAIRYM